MEIYDLLPPGKTPRKNSEQQVKQRLYEQCGQLLWKSTMEVLQLLLLQKSNHAKYREHKKKIKISLIMSKWYGTSEHTRYSAYCGQIPLAESELQRAILLWHIKKKSENNTLDEEYESKISKVHVQNTNEQNDYVKYQKQNYHEDSQPLILASISSSILWSWLICSSTGRSIQIK